MKKIIILLIMLVSLASLFSCEEEEFLAENPKDDLFAENLYTDYDGFRMALNALYDMTARKERESITGSFEQSAIWKIGTDNGRGNYTYSSMYGISNYSERNNPTYGTFEDTFNWLYRVVNSANTLITRSENPDVEWEGASEEEKQANKNRVVAQAKLFRAWAYRHLIYSFGAVPLSTEEITGANYRNDWERTSVSEIKKQIEEDLLYAEEYLPETYENPDVLPKAVARHYLAELYLSMEEPEKAEEKALAVANNSAYSLITERYGVNADEPGVPFMDQFQDGNVLPSEGNTEVLWVILNEPDVEPGESRNIMRRTWVNRYYYDAPITAEHGGRGIGRATMTKWSLDIYESQDDRFSEFAIRKYYLDSEGDTAFHTRTFDNWTGIRDSEWPSTRKWDWVHPDPARLTDAGQYNDQPYLRLAETYLLLAEAQMKIGKNAEAAEWINKIRRRANASEITAGEVTMDFILDERSRELLTEEHRKHTLVRTGTFLERTRSHDPRAAENVQDYHKYFPIPQSVIDANTDYPMEQNPGY